MINRKVSVGHRWGACYAQQGTDLKFVSESVRNEAPCIPVDLITTIAGDVAVFPVWQEEKYPCLQAGTPKRVQCPYP